MSEDVEAIRGSLSGLLKGKRIVLVVTGSVSIYRIPDVARGLIRHGAFVEVFMSRTASRLLNPLIMHWATGVKPLVELSGYTEHVSLCANSDAIVVAPATANLIGKVASGVSDSPASLCLTVAIGAGKPILMVPAMNINMWVNPIVRSNVEKLRNLGVKFLEPIIEEGKAKIPPTDEIIESTIDLTSPRNMSGLRVLVTSGPTREYIDDVKYVTTPSSGLTGYYIAREAAARGAEVYVVSGPVNVKYPNGVNVINVNGVVDMRNAVVEVLKSRRIHIAVFAAAPLDFYVGNRVSGKLSSDVDKVEVTLIKAPKIINEAKAASPSTIIVGYKAEVNVNEDELLKRALRRMSEGSWDIVAAHDVSKLGFGTMNDVYYVVNRDGSYVKIGPAHKRELARIILDKALSMLKLNEK
ncbi:bifunctional phosphopantothenoylcysteine decarboxylase/phosphopantothenate--cysteine ligase CoaBC [Caldivirga maquilingensis]|uniref:Coenzyme A biosynthesis bifunctional protein CoaBC n=1 Tax=Caldivirga maquilingensis (strain ATCC 700844 / DSM 13496 / JCM 10307 / IC-167) TaxID=397948 RepID=A8MAE7_CALMQ|nr:bifunctional phosphopantothenoylcysteine decarboxylase/phosphopantothenate--cysteine ligase CoaBC [Caldivirga maquilingensis]ABW02524.1 phosphopantothenoylcysteine decarboxylase/phosphopantothenate--cysteine ligase [Caldivirga maquilingensis IC-167]